MVSYVLQRIRRVMGVMIGYLGRASRTGLPKQQPPHRVGAPFAELAAGLRELSLRAHARFAYARVAEHQQFDVEIEVVVSRHFGARQQPFGGTWAVFERRSAGLGAVGERASESSARLS